MKKGVRFKKNYGTTSVGEYDKIIWFYQLSLKHKLATENSLKANVLGNSLLSVAWNVSFQTVNICQLVMLLYQLRW